MKSSLKLHGTGPSGYLMLRTILLFMTFAVTSSWPSTQALKSLMCTSCAESLSQQTQGVRLVLHSLCAVFCEYDVCGPGLCRLPALCLINFANFLGVIQGPGCLELRSSAASQTQLSSQSGIPPFSLALFFCHRLAG